MPQPASLLSGPSPHCKHDCKQAGSFPDSTQGRDRAAILGLRIPWLVESVDHAPVNVIRLNKVAEAHDIAGRGRSGRRSNAARARLGSRCWLAVGRLRVHRRHRSGGAVGQYRRASVRNGGEGAIAVRREGGAGARREGIRRRVARAVSPVRREVADTGAAVVGVLGRRPATRLVLSGTDARGRESALVFVVRRSAAASATARLRTIVASRSLRVRRLNRRVRSVGREGLLMTGRRRLVVRMCRRTRLLLGRWLRLRMLRLRSGRLRHRRLVVQVRRARHRLLRLAAGRIAVALGSEGLSVRSKQRRARGNTARNSRHGDECRRAGRRDRLEDALLVHAGAVLALAAGGTLVATATDLCALVST
jgi:hypothetical protein